jgi:hypothetical protein
MSFNRKRNNVRSLLIEIERYLEFNNELADYMPLMTFYLSKICKKTPVEYLNEMILISEFYGSANKLLESFKESDKRILSFEINHIKKFLKNYRFDEYDSVEKVRYSYERR